jgi:hypothetical protein
MPAYRRHPLIQQVVDQREHLARGRTGRLDRRRVRPGVFARNPDRDLRITLGDVDARSTLMNDIHRLAPFYTRVRPMTPTAGRTASSEI